MNHTPQPHDATGKTGEHMIDLVPGVPPVPITVWRTPSAEGQAHLSQRLAYRLIAAYTQPGDTVVDLTDAPTMAAVAAAGDRIHVRAHFTDNHTITATDPTTRPGSRWFRIRTRLHTAEPPELSDWFGDDLLHTDRPPGTTEPDDTPPPEHDVASMRLPSLLVALWPLHERTAANAERLTGLVTAAVRVLRPAGCLILIATPASTPIGDYTSLITTARSVGLRYLQHIIAVDADIEADQLLYHATARDLAHLEDTTHSKIHIDVIVLNTAGGGVHD